jgi:hypothetical protein
MTTPAAQAALTTACGRAASKARPPALPQPARLGGTLEGDNGLRTVATRVACSEPSIPQPVRALALTRRSVGRSVTDREWTLGLRPQCEPAEPCRRGEAAAAGSTMAPAASEPSRYPRRRGWVFLFRGAAAAPGDIPLPWGTQLHFFGVCVVSRLRAAVSWARRPIYVRAAENRTSNGPLASQSSTSAGCGY